MGTRNMAAELFLSFPSHLWVILLAGIITWFGLKWADDAYINGDKYKWATYILLLALAVVPNGYLALFTPTPDMPSLLESRQALPNYLGRFYLDAFFTFVWWAIACFFRSKN